MGIRILQNLFKLIGVRTLAVLTFLLLLGFQTGIEEASSPAGWLGPFAECLVESISNPPTQTQVQAIQNKINELIIALTRPAA